jgi:hypothetical protein
MSASNLGWPTRQVTVRNVLDIPKYKTEKPYRIMDMPKDEVVNILRSNLEFSHNKLIIRDFRGHEDHFNLDLHGFQYSPFLHSTTLKDGDSELQYCGDVIQLVKGLIKAERYICYDLRVSCISS